MKGNGLLYFHQGWTDIVNCLALINIYAEKYTFLYLLIREDASPMIWAYINPIKNVIPIFKPKEHLDNIQWYNLIDNSIKINGLEFIGNPDVWRQRSDPYIGSYMKYPQPKFAFERLFYECYGIPHSNRVDRFSLVRNQNEEEALFSKLNPKSPYICVHTNPSVGTVEVPADANVIELNNSSSVFFDMIKVLQNASEIHCIDSVWAALCYLLDAKYGLLSHIPITVYCYRKFDRMFCEPKQLQNWKLVTMHSHSQLAAERE
jgi:hypothetical protein